MAHKPLHIATGGFLNCPLSINTDGFLWIDESGSPAASGTQAGLEDPRHYTKIPATITPVKFNFEQEEEDFVLLFMSILGGS